MANHLINAKNTALYLKQSVTLPVPPASFIETIDPLVVVPNFAMVDTNRMNGSMNSKDSVVDTCRTSTAFTANVALRETGTLLTNPPEWADLARISGMKQGNATTDTFELVNDLDGIAKGSAVVTTDNGAKAFEFTTTLVGDAQFILPIGEIATLETKISGYIDNAVPKDIAIPVQPSLNVGKPLIVSCADIITLKGDVIPAEQIVFAFNPEIANVYTMGGSQGLKSDTITDYGLTCEITFPVESATFGREASLIQTGDIGKIRVVLGADDTGKAVNGKSFVFIADATKAVTYADSVNNDLLQRVLTLRLYDQPTKPALRIISGKVSAL